VKECPILKKKAHQLEVFSCFAAVAVAVADTSIPAAVSLEHVQESVGQAGLVKHTPFLVARLGCNDYPLVQSSRLSDRALAAGCMDADNDEQSSVAEEHSSAVGQVVADWHLQFQSRRREMQ